jgi:adenine-specific DNA-methyltransferase
VPTLTWLDRETAVKAAEAVPFRVLDFDPKLSAGDPAAENLIIQGDNLDAVKAITPYFAGRVKCFAIDPPYNTRSAFEHYDDNLEHSTWLSMMYPRFELMRDLLAEDGSIWVCIDDNEAHYLKVIMDEVFGRKNFIAEIIWQKRTSRENRAAIGSAHDTILVYGRMEAKAWKDHRNLLPGTGKGYGNPDNDPRGPWRSIPFSAQGYRINQMYEIETPSGKNVSPPKGRCWGATEPVYMDYKKANRVYFPNGGSGRPRIKQFENEEKGLVPMSMWMAADAGDTEESKKEILALFDEESPFGTPKPERLLRQIITIATNPGDIVCDPFLGSGTTAAVAHKMGRRYIGMEMGEHAVTHCVPRLKKVIEGEQGGISRLVNWQGGGGFRFARLGPPIFTPDGAIHPDIRFPTLAAHIWFSETRTAWDGHGRDGSPSRPKNGAPGGRALPTPLLGIHNGTAYYLLFNGILGDKRPLAGNVLNAVTFRHLPPHAGPKIVYGEACQWGADRLRRENIDFRKIPHGLKIR